MRRRHTRRRAGGVPRDPEEDDAPGRRQNRTRPCDPHVDQ